MDGFKRPPQRQPEQQPPVAPPPFAAGVPDVAKRPLGPMTGGVMRPVQPAQAAEPQPDPSTELPPIDPVTEAKPPKRKRRAGLIIAIIAALLALLLIGAAYWYHHSTQPVNASDKGARDITIREGMSFSDVATLLKDRGVIRDTLAFDVYARLHSKRTSVKVGTCRITPAETVDAILDKITKGCQDYRAITFYPGATIEKPLYKPASAQMDQTMYVKYVLKKAGYSDEQIAAGLKKTYKSPLFAGKPASSSLEGYIFGETYHVAKDASVEEVLAEVFKQMNTVVQRNDLVAKYQQRGLNLFQGITMASIVQRELNCEGKPTEERKQRCYSYQQTIAQIFLKRYKEGMSLGSDVTFIYAADMIGVAPRVDLDSKYNTRKYTGLTPGPIATPGELALKAVANPSPTDYVYFIAGDDGLIYFAKTEAEHNTNIKKHCQKLCNEL